MRFDADVFRFATVKTYELPRCCHKMKVSISKCKVRGKSMWRVRWHEAGRIHRKFFTGRDGADSFAATLRGDLVSKRKQLLALPQSDVENLLLVHSESKKRGVDLASLLTLLQSAKDAPASHSIKSVIAEMEESKRKAGRDSDYLNSLENICSAFCKGLESRDVSKFTVKDVERFLDEKKIESRSTLRSRLSTMFKFAVRRGYRVDNPCDQLEIVKVAKKLPQVMSPKEAGICISFLKSNPKDKHTPKKFRPKKGHAHEGLAWFILTSFAGLRPEEAQKCTEKNNLHLNADKPFIEVTPEITKTGQWRIVYPRPEVVSALKWAMDHGSVLPFSDKAKTKLQKKLRQLLGWPKWIQDVTRHSSGSYWLALTNDLKLMVEMLGNSERIFKSHYKKPIQHSEAVKFYDTLKVFLK